MDVVHFGMGSDLMALCGAVRGCAGHDQVKLSYVAAQVTCVDCLRRRVEELLRARRQPQPQPEGDPHGQE